MQRLTWRGRQPALDATNDALWRRVPPDADAAALRAKLVARQLRADCSARDKLLVSALPAYGFSALLLYQPRGLSIAAQLGRTYEARGQVAGAAASNSSARCPAGDISCVYEPLSNCHVRPLT